MADKTIDDKRLADFLVHLVETHISRQAAELFCLYFAGGWKKSELGRKYGLSRSAVDRDLCLAADLAYLVGKSLAKQLGYARTLRLSQTGAQKIFSGMVKNLSDSKKNLSNFDDSIARYFREVSHTIVGKASEILWQVGQGRGNL